ncbi:MAG: caspase domain-containing protein [Alphaproteobacteria bacterium]
MRAFVRGAVFLLAFIPAADAGMAVMPHSRALVIGNAGYAAQPLRNAAGDARAVADRLEALGFAVTAQADATAAAMNAAIGTFAGEIGEGDDVVVYYVGHGVRLRGIDLLVPVDADLASDNLESVLLLGGGVPVDTVVRLLAGRGARTTLVMLDTNFVETSAVGGRWPVRPATLEPGMVVSLAAEPGTFAQDGPAGGRGPYTAALLAALDEPGLTVRQILARVADGVRGLTGGNQRPVADGRASPQTVLYRRLER